MAQFSFLGGVGGISAPGWALLQLHGSPAPPHLKARSRNPSRAMVGTLWSCFLQVPAQPAPPRGSGHTGRLYRILLLPATAYPCPRITPVRYTELHCWPPSSTRPLKRKWLLKYVLFQAVSPQPLHTLGDITNDVCPATAPCSPVPTLICVRTGSFDP